MWSAVAVVEPCAEGMRRMISRLVIAEARFITASLGTAKGVGLSDTAIAQRRQVARALVTALCRDHADRTDIGSGTSPRLIGRWPPAGQPCRAAADSSWHRDRARRWRGSGSRVHRDPRAGPLPCGRRYLLRDHEQAAMRGGRAAAAPATKQRLPAGPTERLSARRPGAARPSWHER